VRGLENLMLGLSPKGTELSRLHNVLSYHVGKLRINVAITVYM